MLGSSWVAAQLTASQQELSSMSEWVPSSQIVYIYYSFALQKDMCVTHFIVGSSMVKLSGWSVEC
jgi:hypothetical protein